jgi:hypothetical protein
MPADGTDAAGSSGQDDDGDNGEADDDEIRPIAIDGAQVETLGGFSVTGATDEAVAAASAFSDLMELQKTSVPIGPLIGRRDAQPAHVDQKIIDGSGEAGAAEESAEEDLSTNGSVAMEESDPESPSKPSNFHAQVFARRRVLSSKLF